MAPARSSVAPLYPTDRASQLPAGHGVVGDLRRYLETKERTEELDGGLEKTDRLINEIVYELIGFTGEEFATVEDAAGD